MDNKQKLCFEFLSLGNILRRYVDNSNGIKLLKNIPEVIAGFSAFYFITGIVKSFRRI